MVSVEQILSVIFALLVIVTLALKLVLHKKPSSELLVKVMKIVKGWWWIFAVIASAALVGSWGIWFLFLILSLYGALEYFRVSRLEALSRMSVRVFYALGIIAFYLLLLLPNLTLAYVFILAMQLVFAGALLLLNKDMGKIPLTIACGLGLTALVAALSCATQLVFLGETYWQTKSAGVSALLILFIVTSLNDVFQFIGGKAFGKRKLVPHLSPNKTEAGFITGILGTATLSSLLLSFLLQTDWWPAFLIGIGLGFAGILGDLFMSAVKRSVGVKDFSDLIPGHGGVMDRLDSLVFTAPAFLLALQILIEVRK